MVLKPLVYSLVDIFFAQIFDSQLYKLLETSLYNSFISFCTGLLKDRFSFIFEVAINNDLLFAWTILPKMSFLVAVVADLFVSACLPIVVEARMATVAVCPRFLGVSCCVVAVMTLVASSVPTLPFVLKAASLLNRGKKLLCL